MARPDGKPAHNKFNPERGALILASLRRGNFLSVAGKAAGVRVETVQAWLARGAEGEEPFATFAAEVEQAESVSEDGLVTTIQNASQSDWRAAAFLLSRRWAARWKEQLASELAGPGGGPIAIDARTALLDRIGGLVKEQRQGSDALDDKPPGDLDPVGHESRGETDE